ncbi:MAG: SpoIIE family protein phosphatase [Thermoleophilaceae bacterium]
MKLEAALKPRGQDVRIANAGHPPPLLLDPGSRPSLLEGGAAPPLGVAAYPGYEEMMVSLAPGSSLVLYTDGLVERSGHSLDDGLARLLQAASLDSPEPEVLCEQLLQRMLSEVSADDVAVLAVQLEPASPRFERVVPAELRALAPLRQSLNLWLSGIGAGGEETYDVLVACGEACTNAIQHAYPPGDASFRVEGSCDEGTLEITISDQGSWRPQAPEAGGLGMQLMEGLMDSVEVSTGAHGSRVTLRRRLGAGPDEGA